MDTKPQPTQNRPKSSQPNRRTPRSDVAVPEGYLAVGKIVGIHGLRGEVKVELYTDYPERFEPGVTLWAGRSGDDDLEALTVRAARPHKNLMLLLLEEVGGREDAEALRGFWLFVEESDAVALEEGAFFVHDILGLTVQTDTGSTLGVIADVLFTGANEVYVVQGKDLPQGEVLLPAIDQVIRSVDLEARTMTVHLLPGLLENTQPSTDANQE